MPGSLNIIFWKNIRTRRRRNPFSPPPASAPGRSGSATASSSSPPIIPPRVSHERVAVLDLLSNGRCEFGMGESASITELTPFGRDMETKREVFEEAVQAIFPMFTKVGGQHHGKYFDIPLRNVVPKPVQKPHPPLWMACSSCRPSNGPARTVSARSASSSSARKRPCLGARLLQRDHKAVKKLADYEINPNMALVPFSCAPKRMRRPARGPRRNLLPVRAALLRRVAEPATSRSRHRQHVGRVQQVEARKSGSAGGRTSRRPDGSPETIRKKYGVSAPRISTR